jgi:hypothetical protein
VGVDMVWICVMMVMVDRTEVDTEEDEQSEEGIVMLSIASSIENVKQTTSQA